MTLKSTRPQPTVRTRIKRRVSAVGRFWMQFFNAPIHTLWGFGLIAALVSVAILLTRLPQTAEFLTRLPQILWADMPQIPLIDTKPAISPKSVAGLVFDASEFPEGDEVIAQYGHFPYIEAAPDDLMVIGSYSRYRDQRFERLQQEAGMALLQMMDAARRDGVWIVVVSGFRDRSRQEMLFQMKVQERGSARAAARTVAPPGYSEHHTGYAVDLADGLSQAADVSRSFGETEAFAWLTRHAQEFGFELSFPPDNPQGVAYEPWHWRYIGTVEAATLWQGRESQNVF